MSTVLEKLKQEEAELEAQMLGNQTDPENPQDTQEPEVSATEDEGFERTEEELAADEFMMDTITSDGTDEGPEEPESLEPQQPEYPEDQLEPEPQPQKPKRTNWKKRFTNYKASTDATINGLRKDLLDMQHQVASLQGELVRAESAKAQREVQGDLFEGAFTQDEEDTFGADGLDVVKKAAKVAIDRQVKPIQEELQRHKEQRVEDLQRRAFEQKRAEYQGFLSKLETLVPEYAELNVDKGFLNWLSQPDEFSGFARGQLFRKAEASRDVTRVADFFTDYKASIEPQTPEIPQEAKRHVTPVGRGGAPTKPRGQIQKGYYRQSDIDKFYSDVMKGRYKDDPGVIAATERAIEEAALENRILRNK